MAPHPEFSSPPMCGRPSPCCSPGATTLTNLCPFKAHLIEEMWGLPSLQADFGIFSRKHRGTQPNLSGEFRNYLVNYSVPTAKWDGSGPGLICFGRCSPCDLAVDGRPGSGSWAFGQGTVISRRIWSHIQGNHEVPCVSAGIKNEE